MNMLQAYISNSMYKELIQCLIYCGFLGAIIDILRGVNNDDLSN